MIMWGSLTLAQYYNKCWRCMSLGVRPYHRAMTLCCSR